MPSEVPVSEPLSNRIWSWSLDIAELLSLFAQAIAIVCFSLYRLFVPAAKKSVRGEIVLITGAGHGLGRQLALNFASLGAKVILWDIDQRKNETVAEEIRKSGGQSWAFQCDVSNEQQVEQVATRVRREVGEVTYLINNAGILPGKPLMKLSNQQIRRTMEINVLSHFWTIRQFIPNMMEMGHGHIVAISSVAGIMGCANLTDYCASKHAVAGLITALREEMYAQGRESSISITIAFPSIMDTGLVQRAKTRFPSIFPVYKVEKAAEIITDGILRNKRFIFFPPIVQVLHKVTYLFPSEVPLLLQRFTGYTIEPND